MKKIILLLSLAITACTAAPAASAMQPLATRSAAMETPTETPTATPDYQATISAADANAYQAQQDSLAAQQDAIRAQETSQAAMVAIVAFTQAAEQVQLEYVRATQAADNATAVMQATNIGLTQQADQATQTYQPTADAINSTQQAIIIANNITQRGLMTQIANEPNRIRQINNAENAWMGYMAQIFAGLGLFTIAVSVLLFAFKHQPTTQPTPTIATVHYAKTEQDGQYKLARMNTDVPCTPATLVDLATGIRKNGMTLGFNGWQGTNVHKDLKGIREFMRDNHMARLLKDRSGEMELTEAGENFLDESIELGDAPLPYKTRPLPQT